MVFSFGSFLFFAGKLLVHVPNIVFFFRKKLKRLFSREYSEQLRSPQRITDSPGAPLFNQ